MDINNHYDVYSFRSIGPMLLPIYTLIVLLSAMVYVVAAVNATAFNVFGLLCVVIIHGLADYCLTLLPEFWQHVNHLKYVQIDVGLVAT